MCHLHFSNTCTGSKVGIHLLEGKLVANPSWRARIKAKLLLDKLALPSVILQHLVPHLRSGGDVVSRQPQSFQEVVDEPHLCPALPFVPSQTRKDLVERRLGSEPRMEKRQP